jgi:hypothetical protein
LSYTFKTDESWAFHTHIGLLFSSIIHFQIHTHLKWGGYELEKNYPSKKWGGEGMRRVQIIDWVCIEYSTKIIIIWVWVRLGRVRTG